LNFHSYRLHDLVLFEKKRENFFLFFSFHINTLLYTTIKEKTQK